MAQARVMVKCQAELYGNEPNLSGHMTDWAEQKRTTITKKLSQRTAIIKTSNKTLPIVAHKTKLYQCTEVSKGQR